jgi:membrane protein YqaA with SNARE-associated domain
MNFELIPVEWGQLALFLSSFLAATVLPFSSTPILIALVLGKANPIVCVINAGIGNTLGGMTCFLLGHAAKWEWIEKYAKVTQSQVLKYQIRIEKWGTVLSLFTWMPLIGDPLAIALGFFRLNWKLVFFYMLVGKTARYAVVVFMVKLGITYSS